MNQILKTKFNKHEEEPDNFYSDLQSNPSPKAKFNKIYQFQFIFSSFVAFLFLIAFFMRIFQLNKNEKISKQLMSIYHVSTLYANSTDYSAELIDNSPKTSFATPFVIGMIKIDKIGLNYPILSDSNKELLDISLCRFAGPMPNEVRKSMYCRS